jgi:predicted RNA binding protein YcfA (HicA-like mRNA interferase family)
MPKRLGSVEVIRVLERRGFVFASQKGSHCKYKNATGRITIVPHPDKMRIAGATPKRWC